MSLGLYNARSCRVRDQHRIRARNQDSEIAAEEIRDWGKGFSGGDSHAHCNRIADSYTATDPITQVWANGKAASHASSQALDFAEPIAVLRSLTGDRCSRRIDID